MPNRCFRYTSSLLALLILGSAHPARAGSEKGSFELVGKLVPAEPGMFKTRYPAVTLSRVDTAFATRTVADGNGQFKFKRLRAGMYTLVAALPQVRVLRKTVDIGPSFADAKGRIFLSIPFERQTPRRRYTVSATVLAIPDDAQAEYRKAHDYLGKGEPERATACLKKAVEIAPQFAGAWNSLGNIAFQSGRLEEAEAYYREALT